MLTSAAQTSGTTTAKGFTAAQLHSTASYQAKDLNGIVLSSNNLTGWNFADQNLTKCEFLQRNTISNADFTDANFTNATFQSVDHARRHQVPAMRTSATPTSKAPISPMRISAGAEVRGARLSLSAQAWQ